MSSRRLRSLALAGLLALPVAMGGFVLDARDTRARARLFDQVLTLVRGRYVDTIGAADLYEKAARGLVGEINDPYASLYSPKELLDFTASTGGRYGGLGMLVEDQQGTIVVSRVYPQTPAEAAGVQAGDRIVAVERQSVRGWKLPQVTDALKGAPGTEVRVTFTRRTVSSPLQLRFTRAVIHIPAIPYTLMLDGRIGYIPLLQFNETSGEEFQAAVTRLAAAGARGLVVDVRGNGGGMVDQAIMVASAFLPAGAEIASVRGRSGDTQRYTVPAPPLAPRVPLVVLVDGYSASASEIVAGALQDHDRALVVGTTSFGKGLVQSLFQLDGGWALKLTTGRWYTPSGRTIQKERPAEGGAPAPASDAIEPDSVRRARPVYRSASGRPVYGGGGITPDVIVRSDTLTTPEQEFLRVVGPTSQELYVTLYEYAMELRDGVHSDFVVRPEWRQELYRRMQEAGVTVDRELYDAAAGEVDRMLADRLARLAFGDSTARRRSVADDAPLARALELLRRGSDQEDLFVTAGRH